MQFSTPPKITLSHWLFFLGYVLLLKLCLVLKLSNTCTRTHQSWRSRWRAGVLACVGLWTHGWETSYFLWLKMGIRFQTTQMLQPFSMLIIFQCHAAYKCRKIITKDLISMLFVIWQWVRCSFGFHEGMVPVSQVFWRNTFPNVLVGTPVEISPMAPEVHRHSFQFWFTISLFRNNFSQETHLQEVV